MIDEQNFFDQPVKSNLIIYDNIPKIATGQGDYYTTGFLLDYTYFKNYQMIAIDLIKQQALDADPKAIQQINFTVNWIRMETEHCFSLLKKQKKKKQKIFHKLSFYQVIYELVNKIIEGEGTIRPGKGTKLARIFNAASSFNKFWNIKVLSKRA